MTISVVIKHDGTVVRTGVLVGTEPFIGFDWASHWHTAIAAMLRLVVDRSTLKTPLLERLVKMHEIEASGGSCGEREWYGAKFAASAVPTGNEWLDLLAAQAAKNPETGYISVMEDIASTAVEVCGLVDVRQAVVDALGGEVL